ncbi:MAG: hypothetical protein FRX49_07150 [Trebouxia sp. A1-2]|nr:MAG: hypothetical protein FRX49_07150 [Trebouxia sp. A1-2]
MLRKDKEAIVQSEVGPHPPVSVKVVCHHLEFALQGMGDDISPKAVLAQDQNKDWELTSC